MLYIGVDVSKLTFDVAYSVGSQSISKVFNNNKNGYVLFLNAIKRHKNNAIICIEATGIYSCGIAQFLASHTMKVIVINPLVIHAFSKMELNRNKTDKSDAQLISRYCKHLASTTDVESKIYQPKSSDYEEIQRLVTRCEQLEKSKTQENNRLEASVSLQTSDSIRRVIKFISAEIIHLKKMITDIVNNNAQLKEQVRLLTSIKGIGCRTAWSILAYMGDIQFFSNAKQIASYAGLTPKISQSGTSISKSSLSKLGHKRLRKSLYMPALVAIRYNPNLKQFYQRLLNKGKPKKVAIIAVMRKLLILSYGVLKSKVPYDLNYQVAS